ncbi:hypothetical protein [Helicobacter apodemus]|uniref:Lipoprotein n=1 Tax=Helicobacter apodemus TaxID=135569 RepID=A0A2U8FDP4_9HELI|nr:hypothetical protein [Helicobacter apodemus]AWI34284.1 hypothetical protein CDV25_05540 [Helicobacter apodemus]
MKITFNSALFYLLLLFALGGCISPRTDAFLLGAGIGSGVTYYFLNGGKIDGISKKSLTQNKQGKIVDVSIPAELEWYYFESELPNYTH